MELCCSFLQAVPSTPTFPRKRLRLGDRLERVVLLRIAEAFFRTPESEGGHVDESGSGI